MRINKLKKASRANILLMVFTFLTVFIFKEDVNAEALYGFEFIPYNITVACPVGDEIMGEDCYNMLIAGELDEYKITNNKVSPGQIIMYAIKAKVPATNSKLVFIQGVYNFDETKVTYIDDPYVNDKSIYYDDGILPWIGDSTSSKKQNSDWDVSVIYDDTRSANTLQLWATAGMKATGPLEKSGYLYTIFFQVNNDVATGTEIELTNDFEASTAADDAIPNPNELKDQFDWSGVSLSIPSGEEPQEADGTLSSLKANGTVEGTTYDYLDGKFVPSSNTDLSYEIIVPNAVDTITFAATATDTVGNQNITNNNLPNSLNVGENNLTIVVTDAQTNLTTYQVKVTRLSNDTSISNVTATNSVSFTENSGKYTATVPYKTDKTNVSISLTDANAVIADDSTDKNGEWLIATDNATDKKNTYNVKVNAEDCKTEYNSVPGNTCTSNSYTFEITRTKPSTDLTLSTLKVDGVEVPEWSPSKKDYVLDDVPYSKNSLDITAELNDPLNEITSGTGTQTIAVGPNKYEIIITGEDTTTNKYTISVKRKSNENSLQTLNVTSNPTSTLVPALTPGVTSYSYSYQSSVTSMSVNAVAKDSNAKVSIVNTTDGANTELVAATSNSATTTINTDVKTIEVIVTPEDENEAKQTYTINLSRQQSGVNTLSALSINPGSLNETFSSGTTSYTATVEANVTEVEVNYTKSDENIRSVVITGNENFHFGAGNFIRIAVTSEQGNVNTYIIEVTRKKYDIATLDEIRVGFDEATPTKITGFNKDTEEYTLYTESSPLPLTTSNITIEYEKTNEHSTVTGDTGTQVVNTGENEYQIVVKSQDEQVTKTYKIKVYKQKNTDNKTGSVIVAGVTATPETVAEGETPKKFSVTLPNSKTTLAPSEVTINAATGATVIKTTNTTLNLSTTSDNIFNYSITSESGDTENYEIYITREKSSNNKITTVFLRIDGETTATRSCNYTGTNKSCKISVPNTTESYYLEPVLPEGATVTPNSTTKYEMDPTNPADSTQTKILTIKAENGAEDTYTVIVERSKSTDASLSSLTLTDVTNGANNNIPISFNSETLTYNVEVDGDVNDIAIDATKTDGKATITETLPHTMNITNYGINNSFKIHVTAENTSVKKEYIINVVRKKKVDASLNKLIIDDSDIIPIPATYDVGTVPYEKTSIKVNAITKDNASAKKEENAIIESITVNGTNITITSDSDIIADIPLKTGANTIIVTTAAQDRSQKETHTITVERTKNDDNGVAKVEIYYDGSFHEATFDNTKNAYTITIPYNTATIQKDTENTNGYVKITPNPGELPTDALANIAMSSKNLVTDDANDGNLNKHTFTVTAEDGTPAIYNLYVTRTKNSVAELIRVNAYKDGEATATSYCTFSGNNRNCTITVADTTNTVKLEGILSAASTNAKIVFTDGANETDTFTLNDEGKANAIARVTPEDGSTPNEYTIEITRTENPDDNALQSLTITGSDGKNYEITPEINDDVTSYSVTIPGEVDKIDVSAIGGVGTTYLGADSGTTNTYTTSVGTKNIIFKVLNAKGQAKNYILEVNKTPHTDADLQNLSYTLVKEDNTQEIVTIDLTNPTSESGNTKTYDIGNIANDYTRINIAAAAKDSYATLSGSVTNQAINVGPNAYDIVVTAQDGVTENHYVINLSRNASNDATLKTINPTNAEYSFNLTSDTPATANYELIVSETHEKFSCDYLTLETNHQNATYVCDEEITLSTTNPNTFKITVTAEDNVTTKEYIINVTKPKSTNNKLKDLTTDGTLNKPFDPNELEYTITVPHGATSVTVNGIKYLESQTIIGNNTYNMDSLPVNDTITISVQPEDGNATTNNYIFHIIEAASNDGTLNNLYVDSYPFTPDGTTFVPTDLEYSIGDIDRTIAELDIHASKNNADAEIHYYYNTKEIKSCYDSENCKIPVSTDLGEGSLKVRVIPADKSKDNTKEYTIKFNKISSNSNTLANITADKGSWDKEFNQVDDSYILSIANTINTVNLNITATSPYSTITVNDTDYVGNGVVKVENIQDGVDTIVNIKVTPEDNSENAKMYAVIIKKVSKDANNDNTLSSLSVTDYSFIGTNTTFNKNNSSYNLGQIPYNLTELTINATPTENTSSVKYFVNGIEQTGNIVTIPKSSYSEITIRVTAEDNSTRDYTIFAAKNPSNDATLSDLKVDGYNLTPEFISSTEDYSITIPNDKDSIDLTAIKNNEYATLKINNEAYTSGDVKTINNLIVGTNTINIEVTAENGTNTKHYKLVVTREGDASSEVITSDTYGHTIADGYIKTFAPTKTALDLKNELDNDNSKLEVWSADESEQIDDDDTVGTGMIVKLIINGTEADRKVVIIKGDVNGDGEVDGLDASDILNHYKENKLLTGCYVVAADVNDDEEVDGLDASDAINHFKENKLIEYK